MARGHAPPLPPGATPPLHLFGSRALASGPSSGTASKAYRTRLGRGLERQPNLAAVQPPASVGPCSGTATSANRECLAAVTVAWASLTVVWCRASSGGAPSAPFGDTPSPPSSSRAPPSHLLQRPSVPSLLRYLCSSSSLLRGADVRCDASRASTALTRCGGGGGTGGLRLWREWRGIP
jgi:hypothetical protein